MPNYCLLCLLLLLACASLACGQAPADLPFCDFDTVAVPWYSKFSRQEVASTERDGGPTKALHLPFDLSQEPRYDWVRGRVEKPLDVSGYKYLSLRVKGSGEGARLLPMLMRRVPQSGDNPNGELVAGAGEYPIVLSFTGWRQLCLPLAAFEGLDRIAGAVDTVNFGLQQAGGARASELWLDDIVFTSEPRGELVPESVPYPPADVAVASEQEFFGLIDLARPGLEDVRKAAEAKDWAGAKAAWGQYLQGRTTPHWLWSRRDRDRIVALYKQQSGGLERHVPGAERVLRREFN